MIERKTLPSTARPATREDVLNQNGSVKVGENVIIKSFYSDQYEQYLLVPGSNADELLAFVDAGRCWVKKETKLK